MNDKFSAIRFLNYRRYGFQMISLLGLVAIVLLQSSFALASTRVLVIGDSLSAGYGLSGPGWVELAGEQLAKENHDVVLLNDSISGDTTAGGVARIKDDIDRLSPDWIAIELGGNDGLRGVPPKEIVSNLQKMVDIAFADNVKVMLLGIQIPPNYGKVYTEAFANTFVTVAERNNIPLLPFFIGEVGTDPDLFQDDGIHPNDEAQAVIRDNVLPFLKQHLGL